MSENKKPRLAEVLGVEIGEKFDIYNDDYYNPYFVDADGYLRDCENDKLYNVPCEIINNPDLIERRPRWTEQEVEDAKAILRMLPTAKHITYYGKDDMCIYDDDNCLLTLPEGLFPSLGRGKSVDIADIIVGNE